MKPSSLFFNCRIKEIINCILTYILFTKQLTSKQLISITAIMVAERIFDALNDPIMGNITYQEICEQLEQKKENVPG